MMKKNILFYVVLVFVLNSCQDNGKSNNPLDGNRATESRILLNDIWNITKINGKDYNDIAQKRPQLEFDSRENKFTGNDSCNEIFGSLKKLTNTNIEFDIIRATRMKCPEMNGAIHYQKLLKEIRYYKIENLTLSLMNAENKVLMVFKKVD
ncbi:META domain-containing protein [Aquimarina aggregata]|uniref:META domain-containing protein n=1 Tax=Aquimarina aggregata TaxID=1642818 RepID=UPI0024917F05|nr:META domain-containing protein [Aquimarina aggregata]